MGRRCQVPDTGPGHRRSQSDRQLLRNIVYLRRHPAERGRRLARDGPGGGQRRVAQLRFLGHGHDHRQRQRCPRSQDDLRADQEHGQRPVHGLGRSFRCGRARRRQLLPLRPSLPSATAGRGWSRVFLGTSASRIAWPSMPKTGPKITTATTALSTVPMGTRPTPRPSSWATSNTTTKSPYRLWSPPRR